MNPNLPNGCSIPGGPANDGDGLDPTFLVPSIAQYRRQLVAASLEAFARTYFPQYFTDDPSIMHKELYDILIAANAHRGARLAIAAPRGHAKSTLITMFYVLWNLCHGRERFIVIVGDTQGQAEGHLDKLKHELRENALLRADFPDVCELPGQMPSPRRWRADQFVTRNGVLVLALGVGQRLRGRSNRQSRPSLIILDDADNDEAADNPARRDKLIEYFDRAIIKAGTAQTNVIVVGTILHYDTLLGRLVDKTKRPMWNSRIYKAISVWPQRQDLWELWERVLHAGWTYDGASGPGAARRFYEAWQIELEEGAEILWPAREDLYKLMVMRATDGRAAFDAEKQNDPVNPADCIFKDEDLHFWDDDGMTVEELLASVPGRLYAAVDPSMGKTCRKHSDSAIVGLLVADKGDRMYVIDANVRRMGPTAIIKALLELQQHRQYALIGVETVGYQEFLYQEIDRTAWHCKIQLPLWQIKTISDKDARIQSLQSMFTSRRLLLSKRHYTLLEQLRRFPKAAQNDGPDALAMAVTLAYEQAGSGTGLLYYNLRTGQIEDPGKGHKTEYWGDVFNERFRRFLAE